VYFRNEPHFDIYHIAANVRIGHFAFVAVQLLATTLATVFFGWFLAEDTEVAEWSKA
jgi:hypothetical protein